MTTGSVGHGLLAGLGASLWTALVGLAVIPFYVRYLGLEGYGLIGFLVTAQAVLQLLDLGLATTVNREVARATASGDLDGARALLRTAAAVQWGTAALVGIGMALLAPLLAGKWLQAGTLSAEQLAGAVALMALVIACRWPGPLYHGALMGAQRIGVSSLLNVISATLAAVGAVLVLAFVSPTIQGLLLWQAAAGLALVLAARAAAWRALGPGRAAFDRAQLRRVALFAAGVSGITVAGVVLTQADKVILSSVLPLAEYGAYMLAVAIATTLYVIAQPFFNVLYPRFSVLAQSGDPVALGETYTVATRLLGAMVFPVAMLFVVYPQDLVRTWTGSEAVALGVAPLLPLLAAGVALHCVMHVPYALQLAHGMPRLSMTISVVMLAVAVPLTVVLASRYGAWGGAAAWLCLHAVSIVVGSWLTHRYLLKGMWGRWLIRDVGVPVAVSAAAGWLAWQTRSVGDPGLYLRLGAGLAWALAAFGLTIAVSPALRAVALQYARDFAPADGVAEAA